MFLRDSDIIELHGEGASDSEISEILGSSVSAVTYRRRKLGLAKNPRYHRTNKFYVAYERGTERYLGQGTYRELSKALGIGPTTLGGYRYRTKCADIPDPPILLYEVDNGI